MAWLGTWKYRRKITIDSTKIDTSDLSHFPVTVFLNTTAGSGNDDVSDIFDELGSNDNRKKIALTTSDGETQLYAEIEKWDDANEQAILHVSKSGWTLANAADTEFYIYFDSSQPDNTTYIGDNGDTAAENVWDSDFKQVFHFAESSGTAAIDSTSNNKNGTYRDGTNASETHPASVAGKIGLARDFDGGDDNIAINDNNYPAIGDNDITIEAWFEKDANGAYHTLYYWGAGAGNGEVKFRSSNSSNYPYFVVSDGTTAITATGDTTYSTGTYYYLVGTFNASEGTVKVYVNGVEKGTSTNANISTLNPPLWERIGIYQEGTDGGFGSPMNGKYDEFRISVGANRRTVSWIKATYNAEMDALIKDYAAKETYSAANTTNFFKAF